MPQRPQPQPDPDQFGAGVDHRAPERGVRLIGGALLAEAVLLVAAAVGVVVDLVVRGIFSGREIGMAAFLVVFAVGIAWALLAGRRALREGRRSGRAVAMTWQLFQGVIGVTALSSGSVWTTALGAVLLALAVGVAVLLVTPRVVAATTRH